MTDGKVAKVERSAMILNRGWIPAEYRDKRSRLEEINKRKLIKVKGVFRQGIDHHAYKIPNNPDNNEWNNASLLDMGTFWDLPNYHECSYYYF
jgi:cytochrome oxidase assembly protein ShyY1